MSLFLAAVLLASGTAGRGEVDPPSLGTRDPVSVTAAEGSTWMQGSYEVWVLRGNCTILQGKNTARSHEAVLWVDRKSETDGARGKVIAYLEGDVRLDFDREGAQARLTDKTWLGRFFTQAEIRVQPARVGAVPDHAPSIYQRGMARRDPDAVGAIRRTQYSQFTGQTPPENVPPPATRRIRVGPRSDVPFEVTWSPDPATNQSIGIITGGVNLIVDGLPEFGSIDVSTDRLVIWTYGIERLDASVQTLQAENLPLEIYMEGNIVFRQGERVIYADRMYYDVSNQIGIVLNGELFTPVPNYEGLVRLRAEVLQQVGQGRFFAQNAFITSSLFGRPGYRLETGGAYFEDFQRPVIDPGTGMPRVNPETGEPLVAHDRLVTAQNNFLYLGEVPIFYWPTIATDLTRPTSYIRRAQLRNDGVFGTQVLTTWDAYQLFGIQNQPEGTQWDISLDYLSKRGFGHGTTYTYLADNFFGIPGPTAGLFDYWGIEDGGLDTLGLDRRDLEPDKDYRYRLLWQHRQMLLGDYQLSAEVNWLSDRYFLDQYFEEEWDELKNQTTGVELKQYLDNMSWSIVADARVNSFLTQTEWLPRADHFWIGQSLLNDSLTWYEHSSAGYARLRPAEPPANPSDTHWLNQLPWESEVEGERLVTRQEIDWPFQLGAVKVVPYALGELGHWGADLAGEDIQRAYGQAGIRASLPMWRVDPNVEDDLFNIHGIAHKIVFEGEFAFAEANEDLSDFPLYDPVDTDSIEYFRHRFADYTFGGTVPARFDERFYAVRSGLASWVSSPSFETADDLMVARLGVEQRWQTKRGFPGRRRIIDWITLDTNLSLFPDAERDNFGEVVGLVDYDFRWHVGDRLTLTSDGIFDFFDQGQRVVNVGGFLSRPPRGSLFLGIRLLDGPVSNTVLSASYSYLMSPKWISSFGMSVDLGERNIGQDFQITRIGESFLISAGVTVDAGRDNVGALLSVEPRFLPKGRLGRVAGARIPPPGLMTLE
ncbi:MAG: LPS-assembly protein LptD [Pirellulales bacterium]|nr:LPS-assembly protein LptD [Pirellulales bacterium]